MTKSKQPSILYVGTFPPRECGIATFTQDLTNAIDKEFAPGVKSKILAINDNGTSFYNYPHKVIRQISETDMGDYLAHAKEINKSSQIKLVNVQHEYGIYGGEWGDYLLPFLELINKPIVITFHTVLPKPEERMIKITRELSEKANSVVVMTHSSAKLLEQIYGIPKKKIRVIPHGVHHVAYPSKTRAKKKLSLSGRTVLSTFGMLNHDKGIEYAIEALPEIVAQFPDVLYLVLGATHPIVAKHEGESYRNKLTRLVTKLGLKDNVKFYNHYLELGELIDYLKATDIYISPTLNPHQAVSGTISYALSCGCPIISTKNQYAKDVVNNERGILVGFKNSKQIKDGLQQILSDRKIMQEMRRNSYFYSRHMTWQNVALAYFKEFNDLAKIMPREKGKMLPINLKHIKALSDDFGIIQFANHTKPDPSSGYCVDDNARAMLAMSMYYQEKPSKQTLEMINKYFRFIKFVQKKNGKFHNFVTYNRTFNDEFESEDSIGRTIWALGHIVGNNYLPENLRRQAETVLKKVINWIIELQSPRAIAFAVIGLHHYYHYLHSYLREDEKKEIAGTIKKSADKLIIKFNNQVNIARKKGNNQWLWFEDKLTYSNHKISESLLLAYQIIEDKEYLQVAETSLKFLSDINFEKEYFSAIGQDGWYYRDGKRAYFDQQPEDTSSAVEALIVAYKITKKANYAEQAKIAFDWFLGKNYLNQMIYDEATGGCYDGLGEESINFNQGAESTISYLLARLSIGKLN